MKFPKRIFNCSAAFLLLVLGGWLLSPVKHGIAQDTAPRLEQLHFRATQGDASAQYELGLKYDIGLNAPQDYQQALKWYRLAADQGHAGAQTILAEIYRKGRGVPQDDWQALKWYQLAADQGDASAQYELGLMYHEKGQSSPQDRTKWFGYKEAFNWYTLAAEQGHASAQFYLGVMYAKGQSVPQDDVYAHMWFNIAASSGVKDASENRDIITKRMTPSQLEKAQELARECYRKEYKGC